MYRQISYLFLLFIWLNRAPAQNIGIGTVSPNVSALLDITSTSKGMLVPRMTTTQRAAIAAPAKGLLVFDNTTNSFWFYNGLAWAEISSAATGPWSVNGNNAYYNGTGTVSIGTTTPNTGASLDLSQSGKPLLLPRLSTVQMEAVAPVAQGMLVYNNTVHSLFTYAKVGEFLNTSVNEWQPVSTGPRMIAWGYVDSLGNIINGSGNFQTGWSRTGFSMSAYDIDVDYNPFYKDSMLLMVQRISDGRLDVLQTVNEAVLSASDRRAVITFTDNSQIYLTDPPLNLPSFFAFVRSSFYFTLYDLRKNPY